MAFVPVVNVYKDRIYTMICCIVICVLSSFTIISLGKRERERVGFLTFIVLLMSRGCKCSVALPHCALAWPAVCVVVSFP